MLKQPEDKGSTSRGLPALEEDGAHHGCSLWQNCHFTRHEEAFSCEPIQQQVKTGLAEQIQNENMTLELLLQMKTCLHVETLMSIRSFPVPFIVPEAPCDLQIFPPRLLVQCTLGNTGQLKSLQVPRGARCKRLG